MSPRWRNALFALASGAVFAASTPPIDATAGVLLGLVAFACATADGRDGGRRGLAFGFGANLVALRFVPEVVTRFTPLPYAVGCVALALLAAAQALPWALGGAVAALVRRRVPQTPSWLAFAIGVYAALFVPAVFPWTPAGGLSRWPELLQSAAIFGERGASFFVAIACGLVARAVLQWPYGGQRTAIRSLLAAAAVASTLLAHGTWRMRRIEAARAAAKHAKVALVSPDFTATDRWDPSRARMMMERLTALTKGAEARGVELTIWPESAYPYTLAHGTRTAPRDARAVLQGDVHGPVLTGIYMKGARGTGYNAAVLATNDGALSRSYDKRHLLWFGETVPLADQLELVRRAFARGTGLAPGNETVRFDTDGIHAAVLNCYEDTLPQAGREAMGVAPNLLVNITNDAWFAGSAEGELHLRLSVLRAIETGRDFVRAVNRGPTAWVSATGRVLARREPQPGTGAPPPLVVDAALLERPDAPYARLADAPLLLILSFLLGTGRLRVLGSTKASERRPWRDDARAGEPA